MGEEADCEIEAVPAAGGCGGDCGPFGTVLASRVASTSGEGTVREPWDSDPAMELGGGGKDWIRRPSFGCLALNEPGEAGAVAQ